MSQTTGLTHKMTTEANYKTQKYTGEQAARIIGIAADAEQGIAPRRDYGTLLAENYTFDELMDIGKEATIDESYLERAAEGVYDERSKVSAEDNPERGALNLEEMLSLANQVEIWNPSERSTYFHDIPSDLMSKLGRAHSEKNRDWRQYPKGCYSHLATWDYEGHSGDLLVLIEKSAAFRLWNAAYQIAVMHQGNLIGCSPRISESKAEKLKAIYGNVEHTTKEQKEEMERLKALRRSQLLEEGLSTARDSLETKIYKLVGGAG